MACCGKLKRLRRLQNERAAQEKARRKRRKLAMIKHKKQTKK